MFSLISGFIRWLMEKEELKVLIVGVDHAGKTTLLEQIKPLYGGTVGVPLEKIPPTVGMNMAKLDMGDKRVVLWDLGGQARLRSIWEPYYAEANALVFVVDSADPARFGEAAEAYAALLRHEDLAGVPALILANKQDVAGAESPEAVAKHLATEEGVEGRECHCLGISALTRDGVGDGIQWLLEHAMPRE